jgi:hypothetical protein
MMIESVTMVIAETTTFLQINSAVFYTHVTVLHASAPPRGEGRLSVLDGRQPTSLFRKPLNHIGVSIIRGKTNASPPHHTGSRWSGPPEDDKMSTFGNVGAH